MKKKTKEQTKYLQKLTQERERERKKGSEVRKNKKQEEDIFVKRREM